MEIKLFCFPYAGGSSFSYKDWCSGLPDFINVHPIELPGRGKRFRAPLLERMEDLVEDVFQAVVSEISPTTSYAFFGHSMGCIIAYELSHILLHRCRNLPLPRHVFFSGRYAPHIKVEGELLCEMPDDQLLREIKALEGIPPQILGNEELVRLLLPVLKADVQAVENYCYRKRAQILNNDFTVFYGSDDWMANKRLQEWRCHTSGRCLFHEIQGGHFFIHENAHTVWKIIHHTLNNCMTVPDSAGRKS